MISTPDLDHIDAVIKQCEQTLFHPLALAINVSTQQISDAAADLLNAGWSVVGTRRTPHTVTMTTVFAIPPKKTDPTAHDIMRRKLEYTYHGRLAA